MKIAFLLFLTLALVACGSNDQIANIKPVADDGNREATVPQPTPTRLIDDRVKVDYYAHMKPEHRKVLQQWLESKPNLRPAVEEIDSYLCKDNVKRSVEEDRSLRDNLGMHGYQYYAVGDMNRDGQLDFAVLLLDTRKYDGDADHFSLAIFNAPFGPKSTPAYYENKLQGIASCYIAFGGNNEKNRLFLGMFESDMICATYYPKGQTYYFKDCEL